MSGSYGVQLWNQVGDLVYDSRQKTLRVLRSGLVTFTSVGQTFLITFPPQTAQPEAFLCDMGCWYSTMTYSKSPVIGKFQKDAQGRYVSATISCEPTWWHIITDYYDPHLPWKISYVIFA